MDTLQVVFFPSINTLNWPVLLHLQPSVFTAPYSLPTPSLSFWKRVYPFSSKTNFCSLCRKPSGDILISLLSKNSSNFFFGILLRPAIGLIIFKILEYVQSKNSSSFLWSNTSPSLVLIIFKFSFPNLWIHSFITVSYTHLTLPTTTIV